MSSNDTIGVGETSVPRGRREAVVLLALLLITVLALVSVGALVRRFRSWQNALARRMNERGEMALRSGQPNLAINFFRSSLSFRRDDPVVGLNLAESLIAENRLDEADSYLQNLWDRQPQDGTVNLNLARLAAHRNQSTDALRYYHNAIYGIWSAEPVQNRISARFELVGFLLQQNAVTQAESELIAMESGLPEDSKLHAKVGQLFLNIGDNRSAENEFLQALKFDPNDAVAATGAGKASFRLGHYRTAILYLDAAMAKTSHDQQSEEMLETARLVLESDPFLRNLSAFEKQERILKSYRTAVNRLETCKKSRMNSPEQSQTQNTGPYGSSLDSLTAHEHQLRTQMQPGLLLTNPELPAAAMSFVFETEEQTAFLCGEPTGADRALLLIGRNREGVER